MLSIDPVHNGYTVEQASLLLRRMHDGVVELPGVMSAAWTDKVPISFFGQGGEFHRTGSKGNAEQGVRPEIYDVEAGYFDTMGIPWMAGHSFENTDPNAPKQVVINERFAQSMFGRGSAVGEQITSADKTWEIVGIVKNTKTTTISELDEPIVYRVLQQEMAAAAPLMGFSLMVRYQGNRGTAVCDDAQRDAGPGPQPGRLQREDDRGASEIHLLVSLAQTLEVSYYLADNRPLQFDNMNAWDYADQFQISLSKSLVSGASVGPSQDMSESSINAQTTAFCWERSSDERSQMGSY